MAGVFKSKAALKRGKRGKWTCWWMDERKKKQSCTGTTGERESLSIAEAMERECKEIRLGLKTRAEKRRKEAEQLPIADHLAEYRAHLVAKEDDRKHVVNTLSAIRRLFDRAAIETVTDIDSDAIGKALGRMRAAPEGGGRGSSARTCNHALSAAKTFIRWLVDNGRLRDAPPGLGSIKPFPEKLDRRRVRRVLTADEMARLLEATERSTRVVVRRESASRWSPVVAEVDGPTRAMCYRVAMATGFRANEVRSLTPASFHLGGDSPTVTLRARVSKRGKRTGRDDVQPIRREMAEVFAAWLEGRPPDKAIFPLPADRTGEILAADLEAAGVAATDDAGRVVDFHALRHSYITHLVRAGVNPKLVQILARHSSITLTLDRYTTVDDSDVRAALEGPVTTTK